MKQYKADIAPHWSKHAGAEHVYLADEVDTEIAKLRKEITLLKVERDNANQHNSIMKQEAIERKRGIADMVEMLEWCQDAVDPYLVDCRKLDKLITKYKKEG